VRAGLAALAFLAIALTIAGCSLLPSPTPAGPTPPPGAIVVPPERMTLSLSNGTTLPVSLVVNGTDVAVIQPQDGINEMPAAQLPPLPWTVEIRSPSGRVLVSAAIHAGDIWQLHDTDGSTEAMSAGARVDLSCGRIDVWSGLQPIGPAPGPGMPGDCAP
jgi:hypothetical protein